MWIKEFFSSVWPILVIYLTSVTCSGWKPIIPPVEYYVTKPTACVTDCDSQNKHSLLDDAEGKETELKSTLLTQTPAFTQRKDYHQSNQKLDLEIFTPTEMSFFEDQTIHKLSPAPVLTYQEVLRKSPTSFFSFKTYGSSNKPTKTIYYGDLELAKLKLADDVKYYKPYKSTIGNDDKITKSASFIRNELGLLRPTKEVLYNEHCSLYKVSFRQDLYYQYIQYKVHMPELKEFTLCLWSRFHNHSHDHSLFSYAVKNHRKAIYMWVSNLNEPGFFSLKIMGQTIFRLNYPIKLYKWYHTCQSWNGNTGEWQVWVNSHRIARGFHNLLVGQKIPGGGTAMSGQENRHFGKGFQEISHYFKGSGGLEGEITMLQMYKVSLTAGKAYNDHTHHHSHHASTTPEPPDLPSEEPSTTTDHPFLENGQLKKHINVLELAEALKNKHIEIPEHHHTAFELYHKSPGHPYVGHIAPLTVHGNTINFLALPNHAIFKRNDESTLKNSQNEPDQDIKELTKQQEKVKFVNTAQVSVQKINYTKGEEEREPVANTVPISLPIKENQMSNQTIKELEESFGDLQNSEEESNERLVDSGFRVGRKRLRRQNSRNSIRVIANRLKRIPVGDMKLIRYSTKDLKSRSDAYKIKDESVASKRHIFYENPYVSFAQVGLVNHDPYSQYGGISPSEFSSGFFHLEQDYLDLHDDGDQNNEFHHENKFKKKIEFEIAESEVRRIMDLCSGCHSDPFRKVAVISWRSTPKKIYSGALFLKAKSECENF